MAEIDIPEGMTKEEFLETFNRWLRPSSPTGYLTATCPRCGEEIDHLREEEVVPAFTIFKVLEGGKAQYEDSEICDVGDFKGFDCPECYETIAPNEGEAIKLFTGGEI